MRFKVGDLVKVISADDEERKKYVGVIGKIIEDTGPDYRWSLTTTGNWLFRDDELELVEESIKTTELKIDSNEIKLSAKPFKITTDMLDLDELYNREILGIWEKENPMIKKEGNEMIESMNLIDLYANKHKESIEKETKEKIENIRNRSSIKKQYDEITKKCIDDLNELFVSQFSENEREAMKEKMIGCSDCDKELKRKTSCYEFGYYISENFITEEIEVLRQENQKKLEELNDLVKTVKAHVGIAKTKEEVEEILTRYGIIDKKGKLVIK